MTIAITGATGATGNSAASSLTDSKAGPYRNVPEADYARALVGFGLPGGFAQAIAGWDTGASHGALLDDSRQLAELIGHPTPPLSVAVADALRAQGA